MSVYPLPSYACSIWQVGDSIFIAIPAVAGDHGHTLKMPASPAGLSTALKILHDRQKHGEQKLGNRGSPTQYEIENDAKYKAWSKALEESTEAKAEAAAKADELLAELGL